MEHWEYTNERESSFRRKKFDQKISTEFVEISDICIPMSDSNKEYVFWKKGEFRWKSILETYIYESMVIESKNLRTVWFLPAIPKRIILHPTRSGWGSRYENSPKHRRMKELVRQMTSTNSRMTNGTSLQSNCKRPPQKIVDPNNANPVDQSSPPFLVPVKSLKRLKDTSRIARFFTGPLDGSPLSQQNMRWQHVIESYVIQKKGNG